MARGTRMWLLTLALAVAALSAAPALGQSPFDEFTDCSAVPLCQNTLEDGGCLCDGSCECAAVCDKCSNSVNQSGIARCECNDKCECIIPTRRTLATLWWNDVINDVVREDYSGLPEREPDQEGPTGTSRALAMVHVAMYDAYAGWTGDGPTYLDFGRDLPRIRGSLRLRRRQGRAAIAAAAFTAMSALYTDEVHSVFLEDRRDEFAATLPNGRGYRDAAAFGVLAAERMLQDREGDGSEVGAEFRDGEPLVFPEMHVVDPLNPGQGFDGPSWGNLRPFSFIDTEEIRSTITSLPDPLDPVLNTYLRDFDEVLELGVLEDSTRTLEETQTGVYYAYDGANNIGVPMRLFNQMVRSIVFARFPTVRDQLRFGELSAVKLFAKINIAMGDCGIQAWHEKYRWNFWRPIVGIRDFCTVENDDTCADWVPLGSPSTNGPSASRSSPNFPAYPSGHAAFGTAVFTVARLELDLPDTFTFTFLSDELNGVNFDIDAAGNEIVRPRAPRTLTIDQAIVGNLRGRVFLGVHWDMDGTMGSVIGSEIGRITQDLFPAVQAIDLDTKCI